MTGFATSTGAADAVAGGAAPRPFSVLFICTANICRSPMAERLLVARVGAQDGVHIASAGVRALVGHPMDSAAAVVLAEHGGAADGHVAQQLTPALIRDTDLLLTAASDHRARILREHPAAMRRVFTLREFARLAARVEPLTGDLSRDQLRAQVAEVAGQRGLAEAAEPAEDEIGDPFGAPIEVMRACGEQVDAAVAAVAQVLFAR